MTLDARVRIQVALPVPVFRTFTYVLDRNWDNPVVPGARVVVPLRSGRAIGFCIGLNPEKGPDTPLRAILDVPDAEPVLTPALLAVCQWVARYYFAPIGLVLRTALPALLTSVAAPRPTPAAIRVAILRNAIPSLRERDEVFARAPAQRALHDLLESLGGRAPVPHLLRQLRASPAALRALVTRGLIEIERQAVRRDPFATRPVPEVTGHIPTALQTAAVEAIVSSPPGAVVLLHGVTGSGKTLVYLEALRRIVVDRRQGAIVLVPEIALTPQTVDRFRAVFGDQVAVLHSGLSDGERYDAWEALRRGEKRIAIGARSAAFAPLPNLGAIVVDEEHESSYKQGETPRYHAREVAIVRARQEGAVVVLGSATPSLESWQNARRGRYRLLTLPDRAGAARLPLVETIDLRRGRAPARDPGDADATFRSVFSERLDSALELTLQRDEQSILLLNRRGFASFLQCGDCGDVVTCPNCSITLTWHQAPERLVCHYCQHQTVVQERCTRCRGTVLRRRGVGTQQVERLLEHRFPSARIARMDVDTTSGKWAHAEILDRVGRKEVDILLGTQMIAKGLDFPNVTLVGVVDADVGINLPDFRASERCFQLLSQVAGRAGRGEKGGIVFIQTRVPAHHAVRCAVTHDYGAFVAEESASRADPEYPPFNRLANVIVSGLRETPTAACATGLADGVQAGIRRLGLPVAMVGPAPCPVERIKNRWRWHFLLKTQNSEAMTRAGRMALALVAQGLPPGMRVVIDRDPTTLL